jgi:16S rRNA (adenine1518-N6/adenine1519-N6)-dimethyltransferase
VLVGCRRATGPELAGPRLWRRADRRWVHGPSSPQARLRALGLRPRRGLSQSFLGDAAVADAIVRAARLDRAGDEVLEVGPGLGILSERLVHLARRVVAIELDAQLADWLRTEFTEAPLEVLRANVLEVNLSALFDQPFVVVANLPYHITSPAIRHLLAAQPKRLVVMTQRQVAERISAPPGELSALSVIVQVQAAPTIVLHVPSSAFYPRPKVDSAVLVLEPLAQPPIARDAVPAFAELVHAGFKQPRKQLGNSLADGLAITKREALELLERAGIEPTRRPHELAIDDWVRLFEVG